MDRNNYNEATNYILSQKQFIEFIDNSVAMVTQKCRDGVPYLEIEKEYVKRLETLNLSRLGSFILIIEIREILEDRISDVPPCIDSFIDGIYACHTGNCSFEYLLRFKNEPTDPSELTRYVEDDVWMNDTSWKENG